MPRGLALAITHRWGCPVEGHGPLAAGSDSAAEVWIQGEQLRPAVRFKNSFRPGSPESWGRKEVQAVGAMGTFPGSPGFLGGGRRAGRGGSPERHLCTGCRDPCSADEPPGHRVTWQGAVSARSMIRHESGCGLSALLWGLLLKLGAGKGSSCKGPTFSISGAQIFAR